jgi:hypothetical protein
MWKHKFLFFFIVVILIYINVHLISEHNPNIHKYVQTDLYYSKQLYFIQHRYVYQNNNTLHLSATNQQIKYVS